MKHWAWALALSCALPVSAAIIPLHPGILDTDTGLEWSSMSASRGLSWEQAGSLPGLRLASGSEFEALLSHSSVRELLQTWGYLGGDHGSLDSDFWLSDTSGDLRLQGHLVFAVNITTGEVIGSFSSTSWEDGRSSPYVGAALIAIPEPATWVLLCVGLLGCRAMTQRSVPLKSP
jgi:hypothetical protein